MSNVHQTGGDSKPGRKTSSLIRNLGITFIEQVVTKGMSFLMILLLTRMLGPEEYGKYSLVFVTVALTSALFDFGMENTAVRFVARDKEKKQAIFGLYLVVKLFTLLNLVLFFLVSGEWFFSSMHKGDVSEYMPFLIMGLIGESLFFVNDTYLQANQRFQMRAILNISRYSISLLYIWILATSGWTMLNLVFYMYLIPVLFSCIFLGKYFSFIQALFRDKLKAAQLAEIARYEQWMFIFSIANNLMSRIDFFMLGFWVGFHQLGIYNAAFQLCAVVSFLPLVLGKVLLPTLAELKEEAIYQTTERIIRITTMVCLGALVLIPFSAWLVPLLLGKEYNDSVFVLQILLLAFIGSLMCMPYEQALYSLGKPKFLSMCRYAQLGMMIAVNFIAIPLFGIYGAALTSLIGRMLYLLGIRHFYRQIEKASEPGSPSAEIARAT
jgi:O-antigen/teichoic acid export membrane protein